MYKEFLKETKGCEILEKEHGFATYYCLDENMYIEDVYVLPKFRREGVCKELDVELCQIAKEKNYKIVTGSVNLLKDIEDIKRSDSMLKTLGYEVYKKYPSAYFYKKEVK